MPYKIVEHTADLALELSGETLKELAESAVFGYITLLTNPENVGIVEVIEFTIIQDNPEGKIVSLINELIYLFETEDFIPHHTDIFVDGDKLFCLVFGEIYNPDKHEFFHCIKSATYGGLKVERVGGVLMATLILDD
ncbi:MAG: archease [Caldisericia bacterium]|nr:archease [Caldisericia bacterium]